MGAPFMFRLTADALEWSKGGFAGRTPYGRIRRMRLGFRPMTMQNHRFLTEIWTRRTEAADRLDVVEKPGRTRTVRCGLSGLRDRVEPPRRCRRWRRAAPDRIAGLPLLAGCGRPHRRGARARRPGGARPAGERVGRRPPSSRLSWRSSSGRRACSFAATGPARSSRTRYRSRCCRAHDPEKWAPVFGIRSCAVVKRAVAPACAPPAPSTWRSAPCGRHSSRGSRSSSRAGASSSR